MRVRQLVAGDAARYSFGVLDPATRRYAYLPEGDYSPEAVTKKIAQEYPDAFAAGTALYTALADEGSDELIGSMTFFDDQRDSVEIGFWLTPDRRGGGRALRSLFATATAARSAGFTSLRARVEVGNEAATELLLRAGYHMVGDPVPPITKSLAHIRLQPFSLSL